MQLPRYHTNVIHFTVRAFIISLQEQTFGFQQLSIPSRQWTSITKTDLQIRTLKKKKTIKKEHLYKRGNRGRPHQKLPVIQTNKIKPGTVINIVHVGFKQNILFKGKADKCHIVFMININ